LEYAVSKAVDGMGVQRAEDLSRGAWMDAERDGWEESSRSRVDSGGDAWGIAATKHSGRSFELIIGVNLLCNFLLEKLLLG
jgi:hypothetical protein